MKKNITSIEEYLAEYPPETRVKLEEIRNLIRKKAPQATESISYGIPTYKTFGKPLVYFAGFKNHIGFYATPTGNTEFTEELTNYKHGKGSIQFPLKREVPLWLIEQMVIFRVKENEEKFRK